MANDNPLLLSINRADAGTIAGNNASASLGVANLQERQITKKWRTPDAAHANTWFSCDFGTDRIIDAVCLIAHNMSQSSAWRVRLTSGIFREWNLLGPKVPADLVLTRASAAYYFDKDGVYKIAGNNIPRFEYHSQTLAPLGLLTETASTNLALNSNDFIDTYWVKNFTAVVSNDAVGPDGLSSADTLLEMSGLQAHWMETGPITTAASTYHTASVFVNPLSRTFVRLFLMDTTGTNGGSATFDLGLGVTLNASVFGTAPFAKGRITRLRNGWYRISVTTQHSGISTKARLQILGDSQQTTFSGDTSKGLRLWEFGVEPGLKPTSPITTTSIPVTRAADGLVATGMGSFWNSSGGAIVVEGRHMTPEEAESKQMIVFSDGTSNEKVEVFITSAGTATANVVDNGISQATMSTVAQINPETNFRIAVGLGVNNFSMIRDDAAPVTDTTGGVPAVTQLQVGPFDGHIRFIAYWASRPETALLQQVTNQSYDFVSSIDPTAAYDSGRLQAWPIVGGFGLLPWGQFNWGDALPPDEAALYTISSYHVLESQRSARHLYVNLYDETNAALYLEAGRLVAGPAWRPSFGMLYDWEIWFEDDSQVDQSLGGQDYADEVPRYRMLRFELDQIDDLEMYANAFDFIDRRKGVVGDIVVIPQPSRPELYIHEAMYGRCRTLHPVRHPSLAGRAKTFLVKELL